MLPTAGYNYWSPSSSLCDCLKAV